MTIRRPVYVISGPGATTITMLTSALTVVGVACLVSATRSPVEVYSDLKVSPDYTDIVLYPESSVNNSNVGVALQVFRVNDGYVFNYKQHNCILCIFGETFNVLRASVTPKPVSDCVVYIENVSGDVDLYGTSVVNTGDVCVDKITPPAHKFKVYAVRNNSKVYLKLKLRLENRTVVSATVFTLAYAPCLTHPTENMHSYICHVKGVKWPCQAGTAMYNATVAWFDEVVRFDKVKVDEVNWLRKMLRDAWSRATRVFVNNAAEVSINTWLVTLPIMILGVLW
ncbi:hypothetical protein CaLGV111 [Clostera anastomosis granulovirus A]|uniref:Uncharacterized protein n=1 Tax=Clostera anastomosis granulovirus A TaxID=1986289 RepID=U5KBV5_9BBAC|nr:hypothetical protein CaLGV111 [Clostera anastomosis granulovirus Henan]AGQ20369.1 hypothetical protein CaLGV111 [Clostera anastomosis granulovirus Henan]